MRSYPHPVFRLFAGCLLDASALAALAGSPGTPVPGAPRTHAAAIWTATIAQPPGSASPPRSAPTPRVAPAAAVPASTLLDEVGHLQRAVPAGECALWKAALRRGRWAPGQDAWLHLWAGEYALARNEQPEEAIWHFRQARRVKSARDGRQSHPLPARAARGPGAAPAARAGGGRCRGWWPCPS